MSFKRFLEFLDDHPGRPQETMPEDAGTLQERQRAEQRRNAIFEVAQTTILQRLTHLAEEGLDPSFVKSGRDVLNIINRLAEEVESQKDVLP